MAIEEMKELKELLFEAGGIMAEIKEKTGLQGEELVAVEKAAVSAFMERKKMERATMKGATVSEGDYAEDEPATDGQRRALHKFGIKKLPDDLTKEYASELLDQLTAAADVDKKRGVTRNEGNGQVAKVRAKINKELGG